MNTKYLMIASAMTMALLGIFATFFPGEILNHLDITSNGTGILGVQIIGALYLGFAMMNWMAKTVLIGGIYAKPLAMGNFLHFAIAAIALVKETLNHPAIKYIWLPAFLYSLFAVLFAMVVFNNPSINKNSNSN